MLTVKEEGITAEVLSSMVGVSRSTARRYLEYLISGKKFMQSLYMEVWGDQREDIFLFLHNKNSSGYMSATVFILYRNNPNYNSSNQHDHCRSNCPQ